MNKKLLCVVKPRKDENIFSYINRLSIENMYETNTWILNDSDFNHYIGPRNLLPWKFDFSSLMNLTGLSLNELLITTFYNEFDYEKGKFKHFNFSLYQDSLMNAHAKVCPRCLETVGIHHKLWDIRIFLVCPIHNCFLVSSCSSCGKPIKQYRKKFYYCKCNKDLRTLKVKNADESNSFVSRIIYYKFNSDTRNFKESNLNLLTKLDLKYI
ncbi:TniQ family protein, partial [Niallia circulans]|uniref:TniQ family protein n=3 Tax=Bacillaceae TaxID=186817 RepID=UPI00300A3929